MEFRFRASKERESNLMNRPPPPTPFPMNPIFSLRYFTDQAIQVGCIGFKDLVPEGQSMEELERELCEERMREEIIARRIAQRRMLEEEARRNLEIEREMNRYPDECFPQPIRVLPPDHQLGPHLSSINADLAQNLPLVPVVEEIEQLPSEIIPSEAGTKRKLNNTTFSETHEVKIPEATQKNWSCALCNVSMTSEEGLNDHLKGKKHKAKHSSGNNETTQISKCGNCSPVNTAVNSQDDKKQKDGPVGGKIVQISVNGEMHDVTENGQFLWCMVCKVKCTGKEALADHLKGKRHLAAVAKTMLRRIE